MGRRAVWIFWFPWGMPLIVAMGFFLAAGSSGLGIRQTWSRHLELKPAILAPKTRDLKSRALDEKSGDWPPIVL